MKLIHVSDPVAGTSYTLDPEEKVARKMPAVRSGMITRSTHAATSGESVAIFKQEIRTAGGAGIAGSAEEIHKKLSAEAKSVAKAKRESLGKQMMEGVQVEGTRTTRTIAAGEIGNDRPIDIVSERWFSPELQLTVMTRTVDPRSGETAFKLINLRRAEPAKYLFEVPADYKIDESGKFEMKVDRKD